MSKPDESVTQNGAAKSEDTEPAAAGQSEQDPAVDVLSDKERVAKLARKMKNYKAKQRKKQKRKNRKNKPPPQDSRKLKKPQKSKAEDSDSSSDSSSSDDDGKSKKSKKGMVSYADRMATDNDILFKGHEAAKREMNAPKQAVPEKKEDDRVMLSGEVTLKNFPLGSARDCEKLAEEVTAILDQKIFEEAINANDVFLFFNKMLSADILANLDMVDTKSLCNKTNALLKNKQKAWHKKKNPSLVPFSPMTFCLSPISSMSVVMFVSLHKNG